MHPFPATADLQFLLKGDAVLESVMVTRSQIGFGLENDCVINLSAAITCLDADGSTADYRPGEPGAAPFLFHRLLGKRLTSVTAEGRTLTLAFEGGGAIRLQSDTSQDEAGQIMDPAGELIVF